MSGPRGLARAALVVVVRGARRPARRSSAEAALWGVSRSAAFLGPGPGDGKTVSTIGSWKQRRQARLRSRAGAGDGDCEKISAVLAGASATRVINYIGSKSAKTLLLRSESFWHQACQYLEKAYIVSKHLRYLLKQFLIMVTTCHATCEPTWT